VYVSVDEDGLHEIAGALPITSSYSALCLSAQPYDWLPGEIQHDTVCDDDLCLDKVDL